MNQDEIIAMANEAGLNSYRIPPSQAVEVWTRFASLVAAKEREACAQLVQGKQELDPYAGVNGWVLADALRARGQKEGA